MDVKCEKCQARYRIDDGRVGPAGLTMRCGKCGNTFKVTRGGSTQAVTPGAPSAPPASKPAPSAESAGQTMMFGVAPVPPAKHAPSAAKPAPAAAKPAPAAPRPGGDEGAGRTMMFGAPPVQQHKPAPAASKPGPPKPAPATAKPPPAHGDQAGSRQVFAAAPAVAAKADAPKAAKGAAAHPPPRSADDEAGSTMMFAGGPPVTPPTQAKAPPPPAPAPPRGPQPEPEEPRTRVRTEPQHEDQPEQAASELTESPPRAAEHVSPLPSEEQSLDGRGVVAEGAVTGELSQGESLVPQPRRVPVIPIAVAAAVIVIALLALVAIKKLGKQPPTAEAEQQMAQAVQTSLKDTPEAYAAAEAGAIAALAIDRRVFFPTGYAALAEIEIGWADALRDKNATDTDVKARRAAASDALNKGIKQDAQNLDLVIAQADYYRSAQSTSSYNKAMKKASALAPGDARVVFVQGLAAAADEEAPERALPLLKQAAEALKDNARVRFRYAQGLAAAKQPEAAVKELAQVLKLSPAHDRAKALLDAEKAKLEPPAEQPAPAADKKGE